MKAVPWLCLAAFLTPQIYAAEEPVALPGPVLPLFTDSQAWPPQDDPTEALRELRQLYTLLGQRGGYFNMAHVGTVSLSL